jgi:hypothetical protein
MSTRLLTRVFAALAALLVPPALGSLPAQGPSSVYAQQMSCQTFAETGKAVCGKFLSYWREHGGLAQQGFPISGELQEVSEVDGKTYTVQYFERAVFELHPENKAPHDVLLSLLGSSLYKQKYPAGAPNQVPNTRPGSALFPQTGKRLGGKFLEYWRTHGGLAQQGYPISDEFQEKSELDGKTYTVQYFERAVFELHPENRPPHDVLLSQLGGFQFKRKYAGGEPKPNSLAVGAWGGDRVRMEVTSSGAVLDYDCAHGTIDQPIVLDAQGRFDVTGVHVFERGGPILDQPEDKHPARYTGSSNGTTLTLIVTITDRNEVVGTYKLTYGQQGRVMKCL